MQHTNATILRQRDEARRVVLHLRSLISGQSHHMEHLVQTLTAPDDLVEELEAGFEEDEEDENVSAEGKMKTCIDPAKEAWMLTHGHS